jgi:hypothetical protein
MVATMLIQTKLNPTPPDPIQAKVMMMMPFIFGVMFFWFPAGLVLYWVVNNVLSIAQQWQITRMIESGGKAANDAKPKSGPATIAAIATAPGRGGIGVVRISGAICCPLPNALTGRSPKPATRPLPISSTIRAAVSTVACCSFSLRPHSFTGEDVLELQGHGGPVVMQMLLARCLELGARLAEPGNSPAAPSSTASSIWPRPRRSLT